MEEQKLRSRSWFGRKGKDGFIYRAWMKNQGIPDYEFNDKPIIGICNTWSELNAVQRTLQGTGRVCKTWHFRGRRFPGRVSGYVLGRNTDKADGHALPQSCKHGCRRIHTRKSA